MSGSRTRQGGLASSVSELSPPAPARPWTGWPIFAIATIVVATAAAYAGSFRGVFVFDDGGTLLENPTLHGLWSALFPPNTGIPVAGRPVANLSFALNRAVTGDRAWGYHAGNLLIHVGAALTLFGIVRRTLIRKFEEAGGGVGTMGQGAALPLAFAVALLWALHPLQTEAVTYLSQRVESLMGLFYLLTLYAFIRAIDGEAGSAAEGEAAAGAGAEGRGGGLRWKIACFASCLLGMGTKEVMVTAPVMLFLYDCTFVSSGPRTAWRARKRLYLALAATWIPLVALVLHTGTRGGSAGFGSEVSWQAYSFTQIRAVALYLRLAVWPHPLIADYGRTLGGPTGEMLADFILLLGLVWLTGWGLWRRSPWGFLGAWFFVILSPSSSVVPVSTELIAERRMYLSLAAAVSAAVFGWAAGVAAISRARSWPAGRTRWIGGAALGALAAALAATTANRNRVYESTLGFWRDVVEKLPDNAGARNNLGNALAEGGDLPGAEAQLRAALKLVPGYATAHYDLGNVLLTRGRADEAIEHYQIALSSLATQPLARRGLAVAAYRVANGLMQRGQPAAAAEYYRKSVEFGPNFVDARVNYGGVLMTLGRPWEAANELRAAEKLEPNSADIHNDLGGILAQSGQLAEAGAEFAEALRLKPDYKEARDNLERVRRLQGAGAQP